MSGLGRLGPPGMEHYDGISTGLGSSTWTGMRRQFSSSDMHDPHRTSFDGWASLVSRSSASMLPERSGTSSAYSSAYSTAGTPIMRRPADEALFPRSADSHGASGIPAGMRGRPFQCGPIDDILAVSSVLGQRPDGYPSWTAEMGGMIPGSAHAQLRHPCAFEHDDWPGHHRSSVRDFPEIFVHDDERLLPRSAPHRTPSFPRDPREAGLAHISVHDDERLLPRSAPTAPNRTPIFPREAGSSSAHISIHDDERLLHRSAPNRTLSARTSPDRGLHIQPVAPLAPRTTNPMQSLVSSSNRKVSRIEHRDQSCLWTAASFRTVLSSFEPARLRLHIRSCYKHFDARRGCQCAER